jgi:hypothetical protein
LAIPKRSVCPASGSEALGVKAYGWPAVTEVGGVPLIVGGLFGAAATVIANAGNAAEAEPSDTEMTTLPNVPTLLAAGVPERLPVVVLKVAQVGRLVIE